MDEQDKIFEKSRKMYTYKTISNYLMYIGIVILFFAIASKLLIVLGAAFVLAGFIIIFIHWRCPVCERRLPLENRHSDIYSHCPYCGSRFQYINSPREPYNGD